MKTKLVISFAILVCSLQLQASTKGTVCIERKLEVAADAAQVAGSLTSLGLPEQYFSKKLPFTVEIASKVCEASNGQGTLSKAPLPYSPSEGDTRVITQKHDGWISEWDQKFEGDAWVATRFTKYKK
jgi:hypothetical protein